MHSIHTVEQALELLVADARGNFTRRLRGATTRMKCESCFVDPRAGEPVDMGI